MSIMFHSPDPTWDSFVGTDTYENYIQTVLPEFYFKDHVPQDVKSNFEVVKDLCQYAYYKYKFLDEAKAKALTTFEMALHFRYQELTNKKWEKNLEKLINWFKPKHYFEVTNEAFLEQIRQVRNSIAHPKHHSFSGQLNRRLIENAIDLINDLYEDVDLRLQRQAKRVSLIDSFRTYTQNGAILEVRGERKVIYHCYVLFVNNKAFPETYYLAFAPIFDISYGKAPDETTWPIMVSSQLIVFQEDQQGCYISIGNNEEILKLYPLQLDEERLIFHNWKNMFKLNEEWQIHALSVEKEVDNHFRKIRRDFHKT